MAGNAIHLTCQELKAKILSIAGAYLDTVPANLVIRNGQVYCADRNDGGAQMDLGDIVRLAGPAGGGLLR